MSTSTLILGQARLSRLARARRVAEAASALWVEMETAYLPRVVETTDERYTLVLPVQQDDDAMTLYSITDLQTGAERTAWLADSLIGDLVSGRGANYGDW